MLFCAQGPTKVVGHWEIDEHEPDCASYWSWYKDFVRGYIDSSLHITDQIPQGCVSPGSGQRVSVLNLIKLTELTLCSVSNIILRISHRELIGGSSVLPLLQVSVECISRVHNSASKRSVTS